MGLGRGESQNIASRSIYGQETCLLPSCGKLFSLKTWNQRFCSRGHQREFGNLAYKNGVETLKAEQAKGGHSMTVRQAVIIRIRSYYLPSSVQGHIYIPLHYIHGAHPKHSYSGGQRLRELGGEGLINYTYDQRTKSYVFHNTWDEIDALWKKECRDIAA